MDLTRFFEIGDGLGLFSVKISQHGEMLAVHHRDDDIRRNIYSASKSFTAAAVGIARREGLLSLDEKLTDAFPDEVPDTIPEPLAKATVRDLLTMQLGQPQAYLMGTVRPTLPEDDWVRYALSRPFTDMPGTRFVYNNVGPYLAGILVQRRAGCDLRAYLTPRLFAPLGIRRPAWEEDPLGNTFGPAGLMLTLDEFHRFGQLLLQGGAWNGRQLIPEEWIAECGSKQAENGSFGYGYLFWLSEHGSFRATGRNGQMTLILKDRDAVVTTLAECSDFDALDRAVFDEIYPQLS